MISPLPPPHLRLLHIHDLLPLPIHHHIRRLLIHLRLQGHGLFLLFFPGRKPLLDRLDHFSKPVEVQRVKYDVAPQIRARQPYWHDSLPFKPHDFFQRIIALIRSYRGLVREEGGCRAGRLDGGPDVLIHADGLVCAPDEATGEEDEEEQETVVELEAGAGEVQFVEKPVDVEGWGGEFVEDEGRGVEVDEGALEAREPKRSAKKCN